MNGLIIMFYPEEDGRRQVTVYINYAWFSG